MGRGICSFIREHTNMTLYMNNIIGLAHVGPLITRSG